MLVCAAFCGAVAVVIDDGVAEDAVEPGDGGGFGVQLGAVLDGAEVSVLQDIFRNGAGFHALFEEAEELFPLW